MPDTLPIANLSDVQDCPNVYGDGLTFNMDFVSEPCSKSPSGQCEYSAADEFELCIHCKQESEL